MLDLTKLESLLGGNEKMVNRFIDIFRTQTPQQLNSLTDAISKSNWSEASITAHAIKSQCKYLGLDDIAELASRIEQLTEKQTQLNLIPGLNEILRSKVNDILN